MDCLVCNNVSVAVLDDKEEMQDVQELSMKYDYITAKAGAFDLERVKRLKNMGFCFLDRTLCGEILLHRVPAEIGRYIRFEALEEDYGEEILTVARKAFVTDRRFHLQMEPDQEQADQLIQAYLNKYREEQATFLVCRYRGKAVGFTTLCTRESKSCENVLGAVLPEYQSKGVALGLYAYMCQHLSELKFEKLYGHISTQNPASLNLHISLGARLAKPMDVYMRRSNGVAAEKKSGL